MPDESSPRWSDLGRPPLDGPALAAALLDHLSGEGGDVERDADEVRAAIGEVQRNTKTTVATGENHYTRFEFQRVLDDPNAGEALQQPALKPLLDEAAD